MEVHIQLRICHTYTARRYIYSYGGTYTAREVHIQLGRYIYS